MKDILGIPSWSPPSPILECRHLHYTTPLWSIILVGTAAQPRMSLSAHPICIATTGVTHGDKAKLLVYRSLTCLHQRATSQISPDNTIHCPTADGQLGPVLSIDIVLHPSNSHTSPPSSS